MLKLIIINSFLLSSLVLNAQSIFPNGFSNAFNAVLKDYPDKFQNIRGTLKESNNEKTWYYSWINIPGSDYCLIDGSINETSLFVNYPEKESFKAEEEYFAFIAGFEKVPLIVSFKKSNLAGDSKNETYYRTSGGKDVYKKTTFIINSANQVYSRLKVVVRLVTGEWPNASMSVWITNDN